MLLVTDKWTSLSDALSAHLSFHHLLMSGPRAQVIITGPTLTSREGKIYFKFNIQSSVELY